MPAMVAAERHHRRELAFSSRGRHTNVCRTIRDFIIVDNESFRDTTAKPQARLQNDLLV